MDMEIVEHSECIANDWKSNDLKKVDCCNFCGHPKPSHSKECPISVADLQTQLDAVTKERDELKARVEFLEARANIIDPPLAQWFQDVQSCRVYRELDHAINSDCHTNLFEAIKEATSREVPKP